MAKSLTAETTQLIPFLPYLLQDFFELGSCPEAMAKLMEKNMPISVGFKVLDLACGKGAVSLKIAEKFNIEVKGIDILPQFIDFAKNKAAERGVSHLCEFIVGDINEAVKTERAYDCVILGAVSDVLGTPFETLNKLKQTVKPGGYIIIDDAFLPDNKSRGDVKFSGEVYLTRSEWTKLFGDAGLKLIASDFGSAGDYPDDCSNSEIGMSYIKTRAAELIRKHPGKKAMFESYVQSQQNEYDDLDDVLTGVTWVLKNKISYFDAHADTITFAMETGKSLLNNDLHLDFSRLLNFDHPIVQVFAIWLHEKHLNNAFEYTNSVIDFFEKEIKANSGIIAIARSFNDIRENAESGKISAILALEGGEPPEGKLEYIDHFYNRGVRLITLTWSRENELGYGVSATPEIGLKPFGFEALRRMNELGIVVDVSHLNIPGFRDVQKTVSKPFIASHSNAFGITPHERNLDDWQIEAIVKSGGVIGLNLHPYFLDESGNANMDNILNHVTHFIKLGAEKNLVLGCDFDGVETLPEGFSDVLSTKKLAEKLSETFGQDISTAIMSGNFYNFLQNNF